MTNKKQYHHLTRHILLITGILCVSLGILGIFLPLLPTTPLLLLAATCFARSSEKFYVRLTEHPRLGSYIRDFNENRCIPRTVKIWSLTSMWSMMGLSAYCFMDSNICRLLMLMVAGGTTIYILSFPEHHG